MLHLWSAHPYNRLLCRSRNALHSLVLNVGGEHHHRPQTTHAVTQWRMRDVDLCSPSAASQSLGGRRRLESYLTFAREPVNHSSLRFSLLARPAH